MLFSELEAPLRKEYPHRYPGEKFSDNSFGAFFQRHAIDIHGPKYQIHGTSKANKLRAFWDIESDSVVGKVMSGMVDEYVVGCELKNKNVDAALLEKVRGVVTRLNGKPQAAKLTQTADDFLNNEFAIPNVHKLPIEAQAIPIIESRLAEARKALGAGAHLSVIFLCGSVLEAVLLGAAQKKPARFNKATASAKDGNGGVKRFHEWSLAQFINVACEIDLAIEVLPYSEDIAPCMQSQLVGSPTQKAAYDAGLLS